MNQDLVYFPAPGDTDGYVELARTPTGRLFRKQILPFGEFVHPVNPKKKIKVDLKMAATLAANFKAGYCDIVQLPIVDADNKHTEDPLRNAGEVVDVQVEDGKGVYAIIDARDKGHADKLGKTLLGASAYMHMNYTDTRTGKKVGPTLLHVAVTNRPYLTNLEDYREIIAASADTLGEDPIVLTPSEDRMDLDELLATLKDEHDIDVLALQESLKAQEDEAEETEDEKASELISALSNVLKAAGANLDTTKLSVVDVAEAVVELSGEKVALESKVAQLVADADALKLSAAQAEVMARKKEGRILPKQEKAMVELYLTNRTRYDELLPDDAVVALSELGVTVHDEAESEVYNKAVEHYAEIAKSMVPKGRQVRS